MVQHLHSIVFFFLLFFLNHPGEGVDVVGECTVIPMSMDCDPKAHRMCKTSSSIMVVTNHGYPDFWDKVTNEFLAWAKKDELHYEQLLEKMKALAFTYVDTYDDNKLS